MKTSLVLVLLTLAVVCLTSGEIRTLHHDITLNFTLLKENFISAALSQRKLLDQFHFYSHFHLHVEQTPQSLQETTPLRRVRAN